MAAGYDLQLNAFGKGGPGGTAEAFINLPLNDHMAVRAVGFYDRSGGFIDNVPASRTYQRPALAADGSVIANPLTINNAALVKKDFNTSDTYGGRLALGIELDDNWTVTPAIVVQDQQTKGSFLFDPRVGDLQVTNFSPTSTHDKWYQAALTIQGKLSDWDVLYSGGYLQRQIDTQQDYSVYTVVYDNFPGYTYFPTATGGALDPTQIYLTHQWLSKQTHELRVSSPSTARLRLTAGMFMQRQANENTADYAIAGLGSIPNSPAVIRNDLFLTRTKIINSDYAAFGQLGYDLTSKLMLTVGGRLFIADNTLSGFSGFQRDETSTDANGALLCLPTTQKDRPCNNINKKFVQSGETHKATLQWQVDPDRMVYATYSTGYRPGGNNRRVGVNSYNADTLDNFELGWKTRWFGRHLTLNGAVYYERWNNLQYGLAPVGSAGVTNIYNAGNARVYGVEGEFNLALGGLTLSGSGAYNNARLTNDFCQIDPATQNPLPSCSATAGTIAAPRGTRLPIQPLFKGQLTARYDTAIGRYNVFAMATLSHQSSSRSYLGVTENNLLGNAPPFETVDFSIGATLDRYRLEVFMQNAFDTRGQLSRNTVCVPSICGAYSRIYPVTPQFYGVKFSQRF